MLGGSLTAQALRHRSGQAVVLVLLSTLITAVAVIGPLYQRAVKESVIRSAIDPAPVSATGMSIHYDADADTGPTGPLLLLGSAAQAYYQPETAGAQLSIGLAYSTQDIVAVTLATREGLCQHLRFVAGSCPGSATDVAVSSETARADRLSVGDRIRLTSDPEAPGLHQTVAVTVAGIYARFDPTTQYWFDRPYVGPVAATHEQPDTIFTGYGFLESTVRLLTQANGKLTVDSFIDVPLDKRSVGLGQVAAVQRALAEARAVMTERQGLLDTSLDSLLADADADQAQVGDVVPLFAGEIVLLAVALLLFVVSAAATQRRPEVALARLRGQRPRAAARPLVAELAVPVVIGLPAGAALAAGCLALARLLWLPDGVPFVVGRPALLALGGALLAQLVVIAAVASRLVREPVVSLLRRIPLRGTRVRLGVVEVGVAALAFSGVITVLSSGLSGPIALLAPGLLALAVGLLAGGTVPVLAARLGPRALARGRVRTGLSALQMARRPGTRGVFVLLVVAVSALVVAADSWQVARDNRQARADVEVGAPGTLEVRAPSVRALAAATGQLDPGGRRVVPAAEIVPPNVGISVLAIRPSGIAALGRWGWADDRPGARELARLSPALPAPLVLTGGSVEIRLAAVSVRAGLPSNLYLDLVGPDGTPVSYDLGVLPTSAAAVTLRRPLPCTDGCRWQGLSIVRTLTDSEPQYVSLEVAGATVYSGETPGTGAATPVDLGPATSWRGSTAALTTPALVSELDSAIADRTVLPDPPSFGISAVAAGAGTGLRLHTYSTGDRIGLVHADVPLLMPALTAGVGQLPGQTVNTFSAGRLDGQTQGYVSIGDLAAVPGLPGRSALVDIDLLARTADVANDGTTYFVWLADGSPASVHRATVALASHQITVTQVSTVVDRLHQLEDSGAVWSLRLGLVSGISGVLVAMAVLVIGVITSLRSRRYDVAALRLSGVPARVTTGAMLGEQLVLGAVGSVVGAGCGVVGARFLFRSAPYLAGGVGFTGARVFTSWLLAVVTWLAVLVVLAAVAALCVRQVVRSAVPDVVRDGVT